MKVLNNPTTQEPSLRLDFGFERIGVQLTLDGKRYHTDNSPYILTVAQARAAGLGEPPKLKVKRQLGCHIEMKMKLGSLQVELKSFDKENRELAEKALTAANGTWYLYFKSDPFEVEE